MNNKEFITELASKLDYSMSQSSKLTESFLGEIVQQLESGNSVNVQGFGAFEIKKKAERISVNPATQIRMLVPPKLVMAFKPHPNLKEKFK